MKIVVLVKGKRSCWIKSFFDINIDFVSIWEPTWLCFAPQSLPKPSQKMIPTWYSILIDFWIAFWTLLAFFWKPRRPQDGPKSPPRWPQDASKKLSPLPRFSVLATKRVPRPPQGHPKTDFKSPNTDFSSILMPTWLLFESKIPPKSNYTSISKGT